MPAAPHPPSNSTNGLDFWLSHIVNHRIPIFDQLTKQVNFHGRILELGSGTAWFSACLSRLPNVTEIVAVEKNIERIQIAKSYFLPEFKAETRKITFENIDFHSAEQLNKKFDFIVSEAALHHTTALADLLIGLRGILNGSGKIVALREPVLPSFMILRYYRKLTFGWRQRLRGDIELTYTSAEWTNIFKEAGFKLSIIPIYINTTRKERLLARLPWLNLTLFNRTIFIATKE